MNDASYRKRLAADLPRWRDAGWVTAEGAGAILGSIEEKRATFGLAAIVGVLGALLLGAGVVAFVGSNWDYMPRIVRFGLLVIAMGIAYGVAALLTARELRVFSEAALLVAGLVFAAAIALVGQTYHLSGDFSGAILLWEIGILGAALMTGSATMTVLALVGAGYWAWVNVVDQHYAPHWASLVPILLAGGIAAWIGSAYARLVAVLVFGFWIGLNILGIAERFDWSFAEVLATETALALLFWAAGTALASMDREVPMLFGRDMIWPGLAATLVAVGLLQTTVYWDDAGGQGLWAVIAAVALVGTTALAALSVQRKGLTPIDAGGAILIGLAAIAYAYWQPEDELPGRLAGGILVLGAALWAVNFGQTGKLRIGKKTGLIAFGLEVIYLYVVTLGTLIDTALAFLLGGLLFIALAWGLYRIDKRLTAPAAEATP